MHKIFKEKKKTKDPGKFTIFFFPMQKLPELLLLGQFVPKWIDGGNSTD